MKYLMQKVYKSVIAVLLVLSIYFLVWSDIGVVMHYKTKQQITVKEQELASLQQEVKKLKKNIAEWETHTFHLEKIAREELCMGYSDEVLYL